MKTIPEYQPTAPASRRRISIRAFVSYAALLTALLFRLPFLVWAEAPLRQIGNPPAALTAWQDTLKVNDTAIATAADGKNVQLHFGVSEAEKPLNEKYFAACYFSAVYHLCPQRVYVGGDDQIINDSKGLYAANEQLPSIAWMRQHNDSMVFTLYPVIRRQAEK